MENKNLPDQPEIPEIPEIPETNSDPKSSEIAILERQFKESFDKLNEIIKLIQNDLNKPLPMDLLSRSTPNGPTLPE